MRNNSLVLHVLFLSGVALASVGISTAAESQCGICHPREKVSFEKSIHAREEVSCADCHRGNPDTRDTDAAHAGDFRPLSHRSGIPELCAECHSVLEKMRAYNLPVDQYAVYQTSQHGRSLAGGDDRTAVCSDCHGAHDTLAPDDPASRVFPSNLPSTCGGCHADDNLMEPYELDIGVIDDYREGVHGHSLLDGRNLAAATCTSCHGVHGATPPGIGDTEKVCGACHVDVRRAFLEGDHYPLMADAGVPECSSCHSHHAIRPLAMDGLESLCSECHGDGSDQVLLGEKLRMMIRSATDEIDRAEALTVRAEREALEIEDHLSRIGEARTLVTEALSLIHTVSLEPVEQVTRRARSIGEEVQHEIYGKLDRRTKHVGLAVFWFYVLMTIAILVFYRSRLARGGESG
jgi:predicted CXXCH cytochrome family protein